VKGIKQPLELVIEHMVLKEEQDKPNSYYITTRGGWHLRIFDNGKFAEVVKEVACVKAIDENNMLLNRIVYGETKPTDKECACLSVSEYMNCTKVCNKNEIKPNRGIDLELVDKAIKDIKTDKELLKECADEMKSFIDYINPNYAYQSDGIIRAYKSINELLTKLNKHLNHE